MRTYRLSNILELEVTEEAFERPADFDLAAWWLASTKRFEKELATDTAQLRVSAAGMKALRELGAAVAQAAEASAGEPDEAGWRRVTIPIESVAHAAAQVLRLGAQAEVLKPAALRRALLERLDAVAALYRGSDQSLAPPPPFLISGSTLYVASVIMSTMLTVYLKSVVVVAQVVQRGRRRRQRPRRIREIRRGRVERDRVGGGEAIAARVEVERDQRADLGDGHGFGLQVMMTPPLGSGATVTETLTTALPEDLVIAFPLIRSSASPPSSAPDRVV